MSNNDNKLTISVKGHVLIKDDLGKTLLDKTNAIHPQNMGRAIARGLANEGNYFIHRIAFGNGGTVVAGDGSITYSAPNDGITDSAGYASSLYNETYSEIIDENSQLIGTGAGANVGGDGPSIPNVPGGPGVYSQEVPSSILSKVIVSAVLNPGEPTGQFLTDQAGPSEDSESDFTFDEIGLFTSGAPNTNKPGYQEVDVGNKTIDSLTGLANSTQYTFTITINGTPYPVAIITPSALLGSGPGGAVTFGDIVTLINSALGGSAVCSITDVEQGVQTFGFLLFTSATSGSGSTISITDETDPGPPGQYWLFSNILDFVQINDGIAGQNQGVVNAPTTPTTEVERLLTHIIFSPVLKAATRTLTITYTLTVQVAQAL